MDTKLDKKGIIIFIIIVFLTYIIVAKIVKTRQIIILLVIILIYIYYKKNWHSPRAFIESFGNLISDLVTISSKESAIINEIHNKLPITIKLEQLKIKYINTLKPFLENLETQEYAVGMLEKINYYFQLMYSNIGLILSNEYYPQNNMVYLLDNQRKLIAQIDDFIFITNGSSKLPTALVELKIMANDTFKSVNQALAEFVNKKTGNELNNTTGFIPMPNEPEPYNIYY